MACDNLRGLGQESLTRACVSGCFSTVDRGLQSPSFQKRRPIMCHTDDRLVELFARLRSPQVQKQLIGERLFPAISKYQPELAGKITGQAEGFELVGAAQ